MKLAACPDCGNACSLTAQTCPRCGRVMENGDLSESNIIKPKGFSIFRDLLVYLFSAILGLITSFIIFIVYFGFLRWDVYYPNIILFVWVITIFIGFVLLGFLFGYIKDKNWWKLGLSLSSLTVITSVVSLLYFLTSDDIENIKFFDITMIILLGLTPLVSAFVGTYSGATYKRSRQKIDTVEE